VLLLQDIKPPNKKINKNIKNRIFTIRSSAKMNENEKKIYQKTYKFFTIKLVRLAHNWSNGTMA